MTYNLVAHFCRKGTKQTSTYWDPESNIYHRNIWVKHFLVKKYLGTNNFDEKTCKNKKIW